MRPKLTVRGVGITKGGVRILDGVDLEVESETFLALIGPSGAGKSNHRYALKNIEAARDVLLEANEELDPETIEETLKLTVPIFEDEGEPVGYQDSEEWRVHVDWAVENGVLPDPIEVEAIMTNEFLPENQEET